MGTGCFRADKLAFSAIIGAMYAALTVAGAAFSYGPFQFRISEALCVLPFMFPHTAWGLFAGCLIANLFGNGPLDIIFGSLATLTAALITSRIRTRFLAPLPPVIINGVVVGMILAYYIGAEGAFWWSTLVFGAQVAFGELVVCYGLGLPLLAAIDKVKDRLPVKGGS